MRLLTPAIGCVLLLLGAACLNYTNAGSIQHHQEWAAANGMPAPSGAILWGGAAAGAAGAFLVGYSVAQRRHVAGAEAA